VRLDLTKDVNVIPGDFDVSVKFKLEDENGNPVTLSNIQAKLYDEAGDLVVDNTQDTQLVLPDTTPGVYIFNYKKDYFKDELLLTVVGDYNNDLFVHNHLFLPLLPVVFTMIIYLRNQIDKSLKSVGRRGLEDIIPNDPQTALDDIVQDFPFGYTDEHCVLYLKLGLSLINVIAPYTAFRLVNFPFAYGSKVLIDAATISALEAQGLFSIDTDYDYSFGGKSLVVRHFGDLSSFLSALVDRFNSEVRVFKSLYRTRGNILIQLPYGFGLGRLLAALPTGYWASRFGVISHIPTG